MEASVLKLAQRGDLVQAVGLRFLEQFLVVFFILVIVLRIPVVAFQSGKFLQQAIKLPFV